MGELVFLEDFGIPNISFFIFADGAEGETKAQHKAQIHGLSYPRTLEQVLLE